MGHKERQELRDTQPRRHFILKIKPSIGRVLGEIMRIERRFGVNLEGEKRAAWVFDLFVREEKIREAHFRLSQVASDRNNTKKRRC